MVNQYFLSNLQRHIKNKLKKNLSGEPYIWVTGSGENQSIEHGLMKKFSRIVKGEADTYQAEEFVSARIPVSGSIISFLDMIIPVINIKGSSIPGVARFATAIPYSVPETFVERYILLGGHKLVPCSLAVEQEMNPKDIIKQNLIKAEAINAINNDKKLFKKLKGNILCIMSSLGKQYYTEVSAANGIFNYPMGMFSVVPYHGYSILMSPDAGITNVARINSPAYPLHEKYLAFTGLAHYISSYPEKGDDVGVLSFDTAAALLLNPILDWLTGSEVEEQ